MITTKYSCFFEELPVFMIILWYPWPGIFPWHKGFEILVQLWLCCMNGLIHNRSMALIVQWPPCVWFKMLCNNTGYKHMRIRVERRTSGERRVADLRHWCCFWWWQRGPWCWPMCSMILYWVFVWRSCETNWFSLPLPPALYCYHRFADGFAARFIPFCTVSAVHSFAGFVFVTGHWLEWQWTTLGVLT